MQNLTNIKISSVVIFIQINIKLREESTQETKYILAEFTKKWQYGVSIF